MNLMEIVKEAREAWNYLNGMSWDTPPQSPEDVKSVIELTRAAATIAITEQYRDNVRAVSQAYTKSVEPQPAQPFPTSTKTHEEIRDEILHARLRDTVEGIKRLDGLAHATEGLVCPLTLIGEYPRECLEEKCMWNGKSVNDCVAHILVRGGDISIKEKGPTP